MFGINTVLSRIADMMKKLNFMSGTIYNIEGIAKRILNKVEKILELLENLDHEDDLSGFHITKITIDQITIEGVIDRMTINEFQKVSATVEATKKNGQPAKVENLRVETDRPDVLGGEVSGDNQLLFRAVEGGVTEPTAVLVTVTADADLDVDEVRELVISDSITVVPGEAEAISLKFGEAEENV